MNNNRGTVLIITLGFILVFTLMGFASIYMGTVHSEMADLRQASEEAFWLADGAIERGYRGIKMSPKILYTDPLIDPNNNDITLGRGTYDIESRLSNCSLSPGVFAPCAGDRHDIIAKGQVLNQTRQIQAVVGKFNIANAITSHGPIGDGCEPQSNAANIDGNCEEYYSFTFEEIFGFPMSDAITSADLNGKLYDAQAEYDAIPVGGVSGTTAIIIDPADPAPSLNLTDTIQALDAYGNPLVPTLLIIDASLASKKPTIHIAGTHGFVGILWIIGEAEFKGTSGITGSVFIDGSNHTKIAGTTNIAYDAGVIDDLVDHLYGGAGPTTFKFISWKEI